MRKCLLIVRSMLLMLALASMGSGCGVGFSENLVSLKVDKPFVKAEDVYSVSCVLTNGKDRPIALFAVGDDGFGYVVEEELNGAWTNDGVTRCGSGRKILKLQPGEVYRFVATCRSGEMLKRIMVEYWEGEPLVTRPFLARTEAFVVKDR